MKDPSTARKKRMASMSFPVRKPPSNGSTGSRKVVDDSDEDEDIAPAKPPTPKAKPKSRS